MTTNQVVPYKERIEGLRVDLTKMAPQLQMVLPRGMSVERLNRITMTCVQNTPALLAANPRSLLAAVVQCAQLGLEPDPVLGQAYLVPFRGKVQLIPGYKGLADLARRSDRVVSVDFESIHANDEFAYELGTAPFIRHKKPLATPRGEFIGAWARAEIRDAKWPQMVVLSRDEVMAIKARSPSKKDGEVVGPWVTDEDVMAMKTALKRLAKLLPLSVALRRAVALDDKAEIDEPQNLEPVLDEPLDVEPA